MQLLISFIRIKKRYKRMSKEESIFEFGDQDYGSAIGWEPAGMKGGSFSRNLLEEDRKRNPRDYARTPDMLSAMPMSWWVAVGAGYPPMEQLFEPPSLGLSKYRRCAIQKWGCKYLKTNGLRVKSVTFRRTLSRYKKCYTYLLWTMGLGVFFGAKNDTPCESLLTAADSPTRVRKTRKVAEQIQRWANAFSCALNLHQKQTKLLKLKANVFVLKAVRKLIVL
jgi:hypothetical protein